jgi:hypothetical protein
MILWASLLGVEEVRGRLEMYQLLPFSGGPGGPQEEINCVTWHPLWCQQTSDDRWIHVLQPLMLTD